jgi:hypothetical protein
MFGIGMLLLPALVIGAAAAASKALAADPATIAAVARRYAFTFVPIGAAVWLAHYGFHLLTGVLTVVPVAQSAAIDLAGRAALGEPAWSWVGMQGGAVYPFQIGAVLLGACGSVALAHATSLRERGNGAARAAWPWFVAIAVLTAGALWILGQPMEMRGVGGG